MKIVVGSTNIAKIEAVKLAFAKVFPKENIKVIGIDVASGVSKQPMSDLESIQGARTRAKNAQKISPADYAIGIEAGIQKVENNWFDCGWVIIINKKGDEGIGSTLRLQTPPKMLKLIKQGMELGYANDLLFKNKNLNQKQGHFGTMTNNNLTRTLGYRDGVISALARFLHPHLF